MMLCAENKKEGRSKQNRGKKILSPPKETENKLILIPSENEDNNLETYLARVWQEITENNVQKMLEDLESLKYVPAKIRKEMAAELLFLERNFE